jgi:hypothetical protein
MAGKDLPKVKANCKSHKSDVSSTLSQLTTSEVRDDPFLGYKIRVLIYDFQNLTKDRSSQKRLDATTDEHYISTPYFQPEEVALIKAALVDVQVDDRLDPNFTDDTVVGVLGNSPLSARIKSQTVDTAIRLMTRNFIEKRKASGDWRPCGPHYLAPVYAAIFGINLT